MAVNWQGDFVNHLGQTETQRSPNAGLRLSIPTGSKLASQLSTLLNR